MSKDDSVNVAGGQRTSFLKRREVLAGGASVTAAISASPAMARSWSDHRGLRGRSWGQSHEVFGDLSVRRAAEAFKRQLIAARRYLIGDPGRQEVNGDDAAYDDYRASFTKTLPHNAIGEVDREAYRALLRALRSGQSADFERIPLSSDPHRTRRLTNPQAAYCFPPSGPDSQASRMAPPPAFVSIDIQGEMLELYWKALLRDVPFARFGYNREVEKALAEINRFPSVAGAPASGKHTLSTLFRGETPGDRTGPYISQFLIQPVPYAGGLVEQLYAASPAGNDYMTGAEDTLAVQNGAVPGRTRLGRARYIDSPRTLADYVHTDYSYQAYLTAALILLGLGPSFLDRNNPGRRSQTQDTFTTLGGPDVLELVAAAAKLALSGAWYQKWLVHRRLRPEAYGARVEVQGRGVKDYGLNRLLFETDALGETRNRQGTRLLSQCYPEGSPTHPAYPAGHATMAGACVTVLKAFFDEDMALPNPVEAAPGGGHLTPVSTTLTVGGELNKLASNISLGRDWAGVHYRSDGIGGMKLGEQMALDLLADRSALYNEDFGGWSLTTFEGRRVTIGGGRVS